VKHNAKFVPQKVRKDMKKQTIIQNTNNHTKRSGTEDKQEQDNNGKERW